MTGGHGSLDPIPRESSGGCGGASSRYTYAKLVLQSVHFVNVQKSALWEESLLHSHPVTEYSKIFDSFVALCPFLPARADSHRTAITQS